MASLCSAWPVVRCPASDPGGGPCAHVPRVTLSSWALWPCSGWRTRLSLGHPSLPSARRAEWTLWGRVCSLSLHQQRCLVWSSGFGQGRGQSRGPGGSGSGLRGRTCWQRRSWDTAAGHPPPPQQPSSPRPLPRQAEAGAPRPCFSQLVLSSQQDEMR